MQNTQFLMLLSHKLGQIQGKILNYVKVSSIFFKTVLFFASSTNMGTGEKTSPPTTQGVVASNSTCPKG